MLRWCRGVGRGGRTVLWLDRIAENQSHKVASASIWAKIARVREASDMSKQVVVYSQKG